MQSSVRKIPRFRIHRFRIHRIRIPRLRIPAWDSIGSSVAAEIKVPNSIRGAVMVLEVRRTDAGRLGNVVAKAMELAELGATSEMPITDEIASVAGDADAPQGQQVAVLYLQAPAKSLDRFYLRLMEDQEGIESVGVAIAFDAPIMQVVDKLRPDPTTVRHTSLELTSENGFVEHFANQLGQQPYAPLSRDSVSAISSNGPDELSQILVLVR